VTARPSILLYHRIAEPTTDPWQLCVSPHHFAEHLEILRRHARVIPLANLSHVMNAPAERTVAITFDDGYADNLAAATLLEKNGVPATVFITSGYIGGDREFWWDELDRLILQTTDLPPVLRLVVGGQSIEFALDAAIEDAHRPARWRAYIDEPNDARQSAYLGIWERLVTRPAAEQRRVLDEIATQSNIPGVRWPSHRPLTRDELATLAAHPLIEIGAHTITHAALPAHPLPVQRREIADSKSQIEEIVGSSLGGFSYPHGRFDDESVRLVRDSGFTYACAVQADHGPETPASHRSYLLPRIMVENWDGDTFERMLMYGFEG
jgi:peptidoglycan/xylan/chitin deacetylase (PgdA/CDA1 family)